MYQIYNLDRLYCISPPSFSNKTMLKMTSFEVKLITDLNMRLMIENGTGGGRSESIYYHAKAIINISTLILIIKQNHI